MGQAEKGRCSSKCGVPCLSIHHLLTSNQGMTKKVNFTPVSQKKSLFGPNRLICSKLLHATSTEEEGRTQQKKCLRHQVARGIELSSMKPPYSQSDHWSISVKLAAAPESMEGAGGLGPDWGLGKAARQKSGDGQ